MRRFLIPILLAIAGLALAAKLAPGEQVAVAEHLANFPDADAITQQMRPAVLVGMLMLPALGGLIYSLSGTLARYVTRQFITMLLITFGALMLIWLLLDFQDNLDEIKASQDMLGTVGKLYAARLPDLIVTLLPYSLLLSVLFSLGRLSKSREVVAMTQTGRGIPRLTAPYLITGILCSILCMGLNYQWAPRANAAEKIILDTARGLNETAAEFVQFKNPRANRLWMVGAFPPDSQKGAPLERVRIVMQNDDRSLRRILVAHTASWNQDTGAWSFTKAKVRKIEAGQPPVYLQDLPDPYIVKTWRETPAEIIRPGLSADQLGVPALVGWLRARPDAKMESKLTYLTQWHNRFAQPVNCLIVVLLAIPLGLVFSRRGTSGGVALAVFLAAGMLFLSNVSLSLGDAGHMSPILAAWLPNLLFGALAAYLLHRRTSGRPIYEAIRRLIPNEA
ncbi:LptF/LptG family permease [Haloferula rosea]|uniref:LptF/LptG family permease n=1 Tax=Haloferula rosea TaxID=490093 RepID=A0A934RBS2_9BACT|nr:LptF/LptG family permease [Haloferula rosea]MBK1828749.1 LptF/LptG family permease [Haloferula rosea]